MAERSDAEGGATARPGADAPAPLPALDIYRSLFEHTINGLAFHELVLDAEGCPIDYVFLEVNAAFEKQTGLRRESILGRRVTEVLPGIERDAADWIGRYGRVALTGESIQFQQFSAILGRWYHVAAFSPARGCFATVFSDVTEHKRLEDALRESEQRYRDRSTELGAVLNTTHVQLALLDRHMRFLMVNDAYERACGHRREELIGRGHFEFFPNEENERIFRRVAATGEPFYVEEKPFEFADQPERGVTYWNWSLVPVKDAAGQVQRVLLSLLDVTGQVAARRAVEELAAERKRAEEALREADRRKTEFLGVLSHELRNPLAPIRNAVWLLDRAEPGGEQARRAKQIVQRQIDHLSRIVDDLLDVTRITRGKIDLQKGRVDLAELVHRTVEDYKALFTARGVELVQHLGSLSVWLDADATRISQAVGNLLQNAAKFTERGGRVEVAVTREPHGTALVRVRDDGLGIVPEILGRIFDPFTQGDDSLHRSRGGLGVGLSLVKGFVELHGGSVEARSDGRGRGAEFLIRLPVAPERPALRGPPRTAVTMRRRRVLVIEDNLDAAETLRDVLLTWDHEVEVAHDGREGVEKARGFRPDVVLCDIGLPVMDGYEVARALRADPALASCVLVAVTGYALPEDQARAMEAGFHRHLGKPVPMDDIEAVLAMEPQRRQP
ncbi:MAG TPA: ATP-binding protein [Anaeromyxobacter sp.]|nr:ATP-binding protein [Anaeromyxobacter sp.]